MKIQLLLLSLLGLGLFLGENKLSIPHGLAGKENLKAELSGEPKSYYQKVVHNYNP